MSSLSCLASSVGPVTPQQSGHKACLPLSHGLLMGQGLRETTDCKQAVYILSHSNFPFPHQRWPVLVLLAHILLALFNEFQMVVLTAGAVLNAQNNTTYCLYTQL